jgi:hypothetical protein
MPPNIVALTIDILFSLFSFIGFASTVVFLFSLVQLFIAKDQIKKKQAVKRVKLAIAFFALSLVLYVVLRMYLNYKYF